MRVAALCAAVVLAALSTTAAAQDQLPAPSPAVQQGSTPPWPPGTRAPPNPANQAVVRACAADTRKLCAGVQPGDGRIVQCFKTHAAELSSDCKAAMTQMRSAAGGGFRRRDGSVPD